MAYKIEPISDERKANHPNDEFMVIETGFKPIFLATCKTRKEAELIVKEWEARDDLTDDVSEFYTEMIEKYSGLLSEDEIKENIKEYS